MRKLYIGLLLMAIWVFASTIAAIASPTTTCKYGHGTHKYKKQSRKIQNCSKIGEKKVKSFYELQKS